MNRPRSIAVATGSRADFGLLQPIMQAIDAHPDLKLLTFAAGAHLLRPAQTINEVSSAFAVAATVEMQCEGETGRFADAEALGRGVAGFATALEEHKPDVLLVLGDRIEAFAAASAASVAGVRVAHMHGGDLAEGVADEAMRHAITKLAHIHLPASARSAERIIAMGEDPLATHLVGSPALDGLDELPSLPDELYGAMGSPEIVFLLHPTGMNVEREWDHARQLLELCRDFGPVLALHPNHDPGRDGVLRAIEQTEGIRVIGHLPRRQFIGLLKRAKMIVGNSSAGLIECAAIPIRCVNVGPRQWGREKPSHVLNCPDWDMSRIHSTLEHALLNPARTVKHPYGDGRSGARTAEILAAFDSDNHPIRKRCTY